MSNIAVTLIKNGVPIELKPERIVDNLGVPYVTARDYLKDLGIVDVDKMTDIEVSEQMYSTYCGESVRILTDKSYANTPTDLTRPYPFGNRAVLNLVSCAYYEEEKSTGFLPKGECVAIGSGEQVKTDTDVSVNYTFDIPVGKKFNKIKIAGNELKKDGLNGISSLKGNVIWGKTSISDPPISDGGMTYYIDGFYYMFYHYTQTSGGVYMYKEGSDTYVHVNSLYFGETEVGRLYYGGILNNEACIFKGSPKVNSGVLTAYRVKLIGKTEYDYSSFTIDLSSLLDFSSSAYHPYAIYGNSNSWYFLVIRSKNYGKVILLKTTSGNFVYKLLADGNEPDISSAYITMICGTVYMCIKRYSTVINDIHILKPNTESFDTATDFDIIDTGLRTTGRIFPCNNGKWYLGGKDMNGSDFDGQGFLTEFKPGLPMLEIDLKEPIESTADSLVSVSVSINIKANKE